MTFNVVNMVVGARQHKLIHWDFHSDKTISMVGTDDGPKKERLSPESEAAVWKKMFCRLQESEVRVGRPVGVCRKGKGNSKKAAVHHQGIQLLQFD